MSNKVFVQSWSLSLFCHCDSLAQQYTAVSSVFRQIHLALVIISRDCEPSLNSLRVVDIRAVHASDPFQPFPRSLSDPSHPVATKCEPRGCAGQSVRSSRINDHRLRFSQCLTMSTWKKKRWKEITWKRTIILICFYAFLNIDSPPVKQPAGLIQSWSSCL